MTNILFPLIVREKGFGIRILEFGIPEGEHG
jgi:hypothetical protein